MAARFSCKKSGGELPGPDVPDYNRELPNVADLAVKASIIKEVASSKTITITGLRPRRGTVISVH